MYFTTTDNGFRSKCCIKPIKIGYKKIKTTNIRVKIWICTNCKKRDVDILSKEQVENLKDVQPIYEGDSV